jgi:hypothetical protein
MFQDNLPVPSSRVKQDSVGKNGCSTLRKVPKDCRSPFMADYIFPAKSVLFLMENNVVNNTLSDYNATRGS